MSVIVVTAYFPIDSGLAYFFKSCLCGAHLMKECKYSVEATKGAGSPRRRGAFRDLKLARGQ